MCGIFAYIGNKKAGNILLKGIKILQNRGYDSVGISTLKDNIYITDKFISELETDDAIKKLEECIFKHNESSLGLVHTRWCTHGEKTIKNSHPHFDNNARFSLVHNGVIENYLEIKKFLEKENIFCQTETDTEVIVQLLSYFANLYNLEKALEKTFEKLVGTWAIVCLDKENPDSLILSKNGSPLLLGLSENEFYIASEMAAFSEYTDKYIRLNDRETIILKRETKFIKERVKTIRDREETFLSPEPFPHWTLREIKEQEKSIFRAFNNGKRIGNEYEVELKGLEKCKDKLLKIKNLLIIASGTSKFAGDFASFIFRQISGFDTVFVVDASEFDKDYLKTPHLGILAISQSGETQDILRCIKDQKVPIFSVVNTVDSSIAKIAECGVYINAGREVAVASTKAFTSSILVLTLIAIWFSQHRNINIEERKKFISCIQDLPKEFTAILHNKEIDSKCDEISQYLMDKQKLFILGKNKSSAISNEGSLKIKEISYLAAEGYPAGSLKHGPFALIEKGTPIIIILLNDVNRSYMESTINEVKSRGACVITITDILDHDFSDIIVKIPSLYSQELTSLLTVLPLQLIAYKLSVLKGINPDKPKNLAKVVSVI
jgi:glucosamine--fructose-6-phosphate aminotransferase (isomerizing)